MVVIREFVFRAILISLLGILLPAGALASSKLDPDKVENAVFSILDEPNDKVKHTEVNRLMKMLYDCGAADRLYTFGSDTPKDTLRMYTLYCLSDYFLSRKRYSLTANSASLALPLCKGNQDKRLYVDCLAKLVVSNYELGNEKKCRTLVADFNEALPKYGFSQNSLVKLVEASKVEEKLGMFDECRNAIDYILKFHKCSQNDKRLALVYMRFASIMHRDGKIGISEGYYKQARDIFAYHSDMIYQCIVEFYLYKLLEKANKDSSKRHFDSYSDLRDSIETELGQNGVDVLDSLMVANGNELPHEESSSNRLVFVFLLLSVALLFGVSLPILRKRRAEHKSDATNPAMGVTATADKVTAPADDVTAPADDVTAPTDDVTPNFVEAFESAVEERMEDGSISLEELSSDLCMTRGQLNRKVKSVSGITASNYILGMRLDKARRLLVEDPDQPVNLVALQCGFENFSYFNRLFKREVGVTPSEFRRRHQKS